jgi:DNA-binding transcriptional regulator YiaG
MDIPALPFSRSLNVVELPNPESYPKELKKIGDHIRAWRIKNHLLQSEVAKLLGVCEDTIAGWEMRGTTPFIRYMPNIIKMIGYVPVTIDTSNLCGQIYYYRVSHGITPKEFGTLIQIDASTILAWEKGLHVPPKRKCEKIEAVIKQGSLLKF